VLEKDPPKKTPRVGVVMIHFINPFKGFYFAIQINATLQAEEAGGTQLMNTLTFGAGYPET
jgi:hypothetical protein